MSLFSSGVIDSEDGFQYLTVARNIYYKGEPVTNPPIQYEQNKNIHMSAFKGKNGKYYTSTGLGYSLALLPAVAITDVVYRIFGVTPPLYFPLESDWIILGLASFTNIFFGAITGTFLLLYLLGLKIKFKIAVLLSLVSIFTTNLFALSKHSFAHMMFTAALIVTVYSIKKSSQSKKLIWFILAGISYGITIIAYNQSFVLTIIPLCLFYFLNNVKNPKKSRLKQIALDLIVFLTSALPFLIGYYWIEKTRGIGLESVRFITRYAEVSAAKLNIPVVIEGLYGQLFSPGRSIFIYSPLLLIIILFWFKLNRKILPELIFFITLSLSYIGFYSTFYTIGKRGEGVTALWPGELSWGPRYLTVLIPFGMILVAYIYTKITKLQKRIIFLPLALIGFYIALLGTVLPYQIKLHDLESPFYINQVQYTSAYYMNIFARYSPIYPMSKKLVKLVQNFPLTLSHGIYNVKFYDGIDFPLRLGGVKYGVRPIDYKGNISFNNQKPIKKIQLQLINLAEPNTVTDAATLSVLLNNKNIYNDNIKSGEKKNVDLNFNENNLLPKLNILTVRSNSNQVGIVNMWINETKINTESIDVPYVSPFGPVLTNYNYDNWGKLNRDPWKTWYIHTQIFERVPDYWWIKALYYWDIPKIPIFILLAINIAAIALFGRILSISIYHRR